MGRSVPLWNSQRPSRYLLGPHAEGTEHASESELARMALASCGLADSRSNVVVQESSHASDMEPWCAPGDQECLARAQVRLAVACNEGQRPSDDQDDVEGLALYSAFTGISDLNPFRHEIRALGEEEAGGWRLEAGGGRNPTPETRNPTPEVDGLERLLDM